MEVAEADVLGLIDDDRIGVRHIKTVLDDGRTQEHIIVSRHKVEDLVLKHLCLHLAVGHTDLHIRYKPLEDVVYGLEFLYPVVYEEYLSSPVQFVIYDFLDLIRVEEHNLCLHRNSVRWRCIDDGEVTGSEKRELQSSRDRSCSERERVYGSLELAQLLFRTHTELLLLVDDEKSEVFEFKSFSYEFMSTDNDVQRSRLESLLDVGNLFCGPETADIVYVAREILES